MAIISSASSYTILREKILSLYHFNSFWRMCISTISFSIPFDKCKHTPFELPYRSFFIIVIVEYNIVSPEFLYAVWKKQHYRFCVESSIRCLINVLQKLLIFYQYSIYQLLARILMLNTYFFQVWNIWFWCYVIKYRRPYLILHKNYRFQTFVKSPRLKIFALGSLPPAPK